MKKATLFLLFTFIITAMFSYQSFATTDFDNIMSLIGNDGYRLIPHPERGMLVRSPQGINIYHIDLDSKKVTSVPDNLRDFPRTLKRNTVIIPTIVSTATEDESINSNNFEDSIREFFVVENEKNSYPMSFGQETPNSYQLDAQAQFKKGLALLESNRSQEALKYLKLAADQNHLEACAHYADTASDPKERVYYYQRAMDLSKGVDQYLQPDLVQFGKMFLEGESVDADLERAFEIFKYTIYAGDFCSELVNLYDKADDKLRGRLINWALTEQVSSLQEVESENLDLSDLLTHHNERLNETDVIHLKNENNALIKQLKELAGIVNSEPLSTAGIPIAEASYGVTETINPNLAQYIPFLVESGMLDKKDSNDARKVRGAMETAGIL